MSRSLLGRSLFFALLLVVGFRASAEWVDLEGCKMAENASNDGDSFHVKHKGREFVFRLYFVDAPETSLLIPERVGEQADAFETTKEEVLEAGKGAAVFTKKRLGRGFKVSTRWEDARGMSKGGRHYAFIETADGEDLGELLLAAGWARSYGMKAATKTSTAAQLQERYDRLEKEARRSGVGIWGGGAGSVELEESEAAEANESGRGEDNLSSVMGNVIDEAIASAALVEESSPPGGEDAPAEAAGSSRPAAKDEAGPRSKTKSPSKDSKIDINTASKEELAALPGIGEVKAAAIIAARPFAGSFDLLRVPGITPATLKEIYPFVGE
jgi:competence ComEA-like helix-hairpin-helix protein